MESFYNPVNFSEPLGTVFLLAEGKIQSCNREAAKMLGYTIAEMMADNPPQSHPAIALFNSPAVLTARSTGQPSFATEKFLQPDGSLRWLSLDTQPLFTADESEAMGMVVTLRDITSNKNLAEDNSSLQGSGFKVFADAVPGILYLFDATAKRNIYVNSQSKELLGYEPQEIVSLGNRFMCQRMHPDDLAKFPTHLERLERSQQGEAIRLEYRMRHRNGEWRWFSTHDRVYIRSADGQVEQILGIARDITQRKQSEIALKESEERLKLATVASGTGMWFWDITSNTIEWTKQCQGIFGESLAKISSYEQFFQKLHPDDRQPTKEAVDRALENNTEYSHEYRVVWSDGSIHSVIAKGKGFYNRQGKPVRMIGTLQDITAIKRSQDELRKQQELLKLALASAKAGTWNWNFQQEEIIWSPENYAIFGIDPAIAPLSFADVENCIHPDDREPIKQELAKVLAKESIFHSEFRIYHPERGLRWLLGIGNISCDSSSQPIGISGISLDITHAKEVEATLKQRERELELIVEVIPQQIWTAGKDGHISYINQRWQDYTGLDLEQMRGRGWAAIVHPEDLPVIKTKWIEAIIAGEKFDCEARLRDAAGKYHWFLSKARPLRNERGEILKWYGTNTSIIRIKELEAKLVQQTQDLLDANELKDQFLAIVSHELRTPLNPILGWSQMLATGKLDPEKTAMGIEIIERNAKAQAQLINDLLDVSRILRNKLNLDKQPLSLESIIRSAIPTVQLSANTKLIQIETEFVPKVGKVLGDLSRLQQIIWNLLSNAIKFTPEGGRVLVKLKQSGANAVISIEDTGRGIEPEFIPHVFDRFRQEDSGNTREFGGLGLGLAIVRHLIELHGGSVTAFSAGLNRGATFSVRLPLIDRSPAAENLLEPNIPSVRPKRFQGKTILVVDDEIDSLDILILVLEQEGAKVLSAKSAQSALDILQQTVPDLIVSDIGMPQTDGYSLIARVRELPQGKDIRAIALTAYAGEIDRQRSLDGGFQQHLTKPINIPEFIQTIASLFE